MCEHENHNPTVAMWFLASASGNADGHTVDDTFTPVLVKSLEVQLSDHTLGLTVSTGILTDFDLRKYFGDQDMPVYSMVYRVLLKSPISVSAFRKLQIKLLNDLPPEVDASSSFVLFGQEGLILDNDAGIRGVVLIPFSGLINIIGAGALARYIVADIGGSDKSVWLSQVSAITVTLLGPAIAQATDLWGRKWFVVSTTLLGFAGFLVVSRATTINVAIAGEILAALGYSSQALLNAIASEILPRRYRPAAQGGLGLTSGLEAAFSLLLGFYLSTLQSSTAVWAYPVFLGLGLDAAISNVTTIAQLSAPPALIAVTSGLIAGVRSFGGSVALPIFNSVYKSTSSKHIGPNVIAAVVPLGLPKSSLQALAEALAANNAEAVAKIPGMTPQITAAAEMAVKRTFLLSYRYVWVIMACFSLVGTVAAFFLKNTKEDMTMSVDAPLNREIVVEESNN
ncbi:hypothetical protein KCU95_g6703, partial [Aureobasidium melanogenum]